MLRLRSWIAYTVVSLSGLAALGACTGAAPDSSSTWGVQRSAAIVDGWTITPASGSVTKRAAGRLLLSNASTTSTNVQKLISLADDFTIAFRQRVGTFGTEQGTVIYANGIRVQLYFKPNEIRARDATGGITSFPFDVGHEFHEYEVVVRSSQRGTLFADGRLLGSFTLQAATGEAERIAHWVKGPVGAEIELDGTHVWNGQAFTTTKDWKDGTAGWSVSGSGLTQLSTGVRLLPPANTTLSLERALDSASRYRVHFGAQVSQHGDENAFALYDGQYAAMLYVESNGVRVRQSDGTRIRLVTWDSATSMAHHDYEVLTRSGVGHLYIDGKYRGEWRLRADSTSARVRHWSKSSTSLAQGIVSYTYVRPSLTQPHVLEFDFEDETGGQQPSYWWETNTTDTWSGNVWKVKTQDEGKVYRRMDQGYDGSLSLLHYFAKNVTFTGRFRINAVPTGSGVDPTLYIQARRNMEEARVVASYRVNQSKWKLVERKDVGSSAVTIQEHSQTLALATWHDFKLEVKDETAKYWLDGTKILDTTAEDPDYSLTHQNFGRVGIQAKEADVSWDDLRIDVADPENGRAMNGVQEFTFRDDESASRTAVIGLSNELLAVAGNGVYRWPNGASAWTLDTSSTGVGSNMLALPEGLLHFFKKTSFKDGDGQTVTCPPNLEAQLVDLSTDGGLTFGSPTVVAGCMTGKSMPDKVFADSQGQVFLGHGASPTGADHSGNASRSRIFRRDSAGVWHLGEVPDGCKVCELPAGCDYIGDPDAEVSCELPTTCSLPAVCEIFTGFFAPDQVTPLALSEVDIVEAAPDLHKAFFRTNVGYLYESVSTDGGATWGKPRPTLFRSTRTSFNIDRDPTTGYHYMAWEYDDASLSSSDHLPRTRLALAVSRDGTESWEFVGDLDDFKGLGRHLNTGLRVIGDFIWIGTSSCDGNITMSKECDRPEGFRYSRLWKIDKRLIEPTPRFPGTH